MRIENLTTYSVMELMGSNATMDEARNMLQLLVGSGFTDTNDFSDDEWLALMDEAIDDTYPH